MTWFASDDMRGDLLVHRALWAAAERVMDDADCVLALDVNEKWFCSHFESTLQSHPLLLDKIKAAFAERRVAMSFGAGRDVERLNHQEQEVIMMDNHYDDPIDTVRNIVNTICVPIRDLERVLDARRLTLNDFSRLRRIAMHSRGYVRRAAQRVLDAIYAEAMPVGRNA